MIKNVAVIIPSYKRLIEVRHQIYSMINQTFVPYRIFVAVKGFSEDRVSHFIKKSFEKYDFVKVKYMSNKSQLSNILDCIRNEDMSDIDLFVKCDDDDIYLPDYLKNIVDFHNNAKDRKIHGSGSNCAFVMENRSPDIFLYKDFRTYSFGGEMAFSKEVVKFLFDFESGDKEAIEKMSHVLEYSNYMEDKFIQVVCKDVFGEFLIRPNGDDYLYNASNNSCCFNSESYSGQDEDGLIKAKDWSKMREEDFVHVVHPTWGEDVLKIRGSRFNRINANSEKGTVLFFDPDTLIIQWDNWGKEKFSRAAKGDFFVFNEDKYLL